MSEQITDEQIEQLAASGKPFSMVHLRWAPGRDQDGADAIEREHQRRMVSLRADGVIAALFPVLSDSLAGVAVLTRTPEEAEAIIAADPCVQAGMMTFEVYACVGFPGDAIS